jgi:integrase
MGKLNSARINALVKKPGRHSDGEGLFFRVLPGAKCYWVFRYRMDGKEREMSLGPYPETSLLDARAKHAEKRKQVKADKVDPLAEKQAARSAAAQRQTTAPTFGEAADEYLKSHRGEWSNVRHRRQWTKALTGYCAPIRDTPVDQVDTKAVVAVLLPLWHRVPTTASRLRGRIETVLDYAKGDDDARPNPARWKGHLQKKLPNPKKVRPLVHHPAMPYAEVPAFMEKLRGVDATAARALEFVILTAARSGEVLRAVWDEISDLDQPNSTWTVPAERMKMKRPHQVPLSDRAVAILKALLAKRPVSMSGPHPFVFPGMRPRQPLSDMGMLNLMDRLGAGDYTIHGFRSSFRDWAGDSGIDFEVAEQSLAHDVGNQVTRAYLRSTMLERRRAAMQSWCGHLKGEDAKVVQIAGRKRR